MERSEIRQWVIKTASVTKPYDREWSVSVTLVSDINETADTIEKAYNKLTERIYLSPYLNNKLEEFITP